jgi:hypothetical protein
LRGIKARSRKATSIQIVAQMDELFGIDAQARQEGLSQSDRHVLRFQKSKPLLEQIKVAAVTSSDSIPNSFHVLQEDLLTAAVVEFRGPAIGVAGDPLSGFQSAVIFQKIRDAGGPE